jgi:hypothetical protein
MTFQAHPLSRDAFSHLLDQPDAALRQHLARRVRVDAKPGFPCRLSLEDAEIGEEVLLVNYEHQPVDGPFRSSHAVYVRPEATAAVLKPGELPPFFHGRTLSLRAFDATGMMADAALVEGSEAGPAIEALLADPKVSYLHAHFAKFGCYAARIERA